MHPLLILSFFFLSLFVKNLLMQLTSNPKLNPTIGSSRPSIYWNFPLPPILFKIILFSRPTSYVIYGSSFNKLKFYFWFWQNRFENSSANCCTKNILIGKSWNFLGWNVSLKFVNVEIFAKLTNFETYFSSKNLKILDFSFI